MCPALSTSRSGILNHFFFHTRFFFMLNIVTTILIKEGCSSMNKEPHTVDGQTITSRIIFIIILSVNLNHLFITGYWALRSLSPKPQSPLTLVWFHTKSKVKFWFVQGGKPSDHSYFWFVIFLLHCSVIGHLHKKVFSKIFSGWPTAILYLHTCRIV